MKLHAVYDALLCEFNCGFVSIDDDIIIIVCSQYPVFERSRCRKLGSHQIMRSPLSDSC